MALLVAALAAFAVGCTDESPDPVTKPSTSAPSTTADTISPSPDGLAERAKSAVSGVSVDEEAFVESGLATVREGARNLSPLVKGKRYEAVVACAGTGTVDVIIGSAASQAQACDGKAVTYRIPSAPAELLLTVKGRPGASGAVAWQINAEASH
ncbi:hypothetical protein O1L60_19630 [Streptomyces diastatochromogenes]|nr:hypothetical protein [Streptomyces diastatochromogenes]